MATTFTLTADDRGRVDIEVVYAGTSTTVNAIKVQRMDPMANPDATLPGGGTVTFDVRNPNAFAPVVTATTKTFTVVDWEAPMGVDTWYRYALGNSATGVYGAWSSWLRVSMPDGWMVCDPVTHDEAVVVPEQVDMSFAYRRKRAVYTPLNGSKDIVFAGAYRGVEFDLPLVFTAEPEWKNLLRLMRSGQTLLVKNGSLLGGAIYIAAPEVLDVALTDVGGVPLRRVTLHCSEVARP